METQLFKVAAASAALLLAMPAAAAAPHWSSPGRPADAGVTVHRGGPPPGGMRIDDGDWNGDWEWSDDRGRDRRQRSGRGFVYYDNDAWAYYNNRSFESDSYNDWWHDRPDRAFPRWMQSNQNCERQWWSGGVWRC